MADLRPVYLICGDDDAKIDAWRARVRGRAEAELGPGGLEAFDARSSSPEAVAAAMAALTFATGTRYLLVDDAGAWKAGDLDPLLAAIADPPPDLVLVVIVRGKPLKGLVKAVEKAGGEVREHPAPKPWELPRWIAERARELGLVMDSEGARTLLAITGPSQQRLSRELEKLSIAIHPETQISVGEVEQYAAGDLQPKVYDLADALVGGHREDALRLAEELTAGDERSSRFVYPIIGRLREVLRIVELLEAGVPEAELPKALKAPSWRVKKAAALARNADRLTLQGTLCRFAELELDLRSPGGLDEDTAVTLALAA